MHTTSLVGRDEAIDEVVALLSDGDRRLVTLTGPGGIGKTRLAMAAAERLSDRFDAGTVFVSFAEVTDPAAVVPRVGWALGADLAGAPSPLTALADLLDHERWLLVLDNLERLVAAGPEVAELLARSPGVAVLATSTTVLGVRAEHAYPVRPLPVPDVQDSTALPDLVENPAVRLFLDRARAVRPGFALTADDASAVVEICRRLEGLPLAIELAAARVRLLDPAAVLRRLSRSLDTLGTGMADLPERQRTLRATVEWSIGMLNHAEGSLLEVLAVFADGWTVEAAAQVAGLDEDRALDLIESLARHSLIHLDETPAGPRPRMLHTVRAFVGERLDARPDGDEVRRRHAQHYRLLAESCDQPLRGFRQLACAEILAAEHENIGVAVRWHLAHDPAPLPHLFRVLSPFRLLWPFLGLGDVIIGEARSWVSELLPDVDALPPAERAELLGTAVVSALEVGDSAAAEASGRRLAALLDDLDDPYLAAVSRLLVAWVAALVRDVDGARRWLADAVDRLRRLDEPMWTALALVTSGSVAAAGGDLDEARGHVTEARRLAGRFDNPWLATVSRVVLGLLALGRHDLDAARAELSEALALAVSGRSTHCLCMVLDGAVSLALAQRDSERAAVLVGASEGLRRRAALRVWASMRRDDELAAAVREATGSERFGELFTTGTRLGRQDVLDLARDSLR
ncbi:ATP-binding protein [Blastococcus sp. SYSU DS0619]